MVIFHSYVSLPESKWKKQQAWELLGIDSPVAFQNYVKRGGLDPV